MLLFSTAVFTVAQWIFFATAGGTVTVTSFDHMIFL